MLTGFQHPIYIATAPVDMRKSVRLMYSRQDQWREDALLIMYECNNRGRLTDHRTYEVS